MLTNRSNEWQSLIGHPMFQAVDDTVSNLVLELHPDYYGEDSDEERLKIFARIGSCLGMPVAELDKIVASVHEAWH